MHVLLMLSTGPSLYIVLPCTPEVWSGFRCVALTSHSGEAANLLVLHSPRALAGGTGAVVHPCLSPEGAELRTAQLWLSSMFSLIALLRCFIVLRPLLNLRCCSDVATF